MNIITIASNKGGAGKSTLAVNLAVALYGLKKSVVIIDLDPQGTASRWSRQRETDDPDVLAIQAHQLDGVLESARKHGADYALIDTAPHSETTALAACRVADLVVVPCRPSLPDIDAIKHTVDLLAIAKSPGHIVINAAKTVGSKLDGKEALQMSGLPLVPVVISDRIAFNHAFTAGLGVVEYDSTSKAAQEISQLTKWLVTELKS